MINPENDKKATLLIVDDEPDNIRVLGGILREDHKILWATSGKQALELAQSKGPDLILLDVMMPGMDGYSVCSKLQDHPLTKKIPVIFVTALEQEQHEIIGLGLGAIDYLTKPVNPAITQLRIRNYLELKRARDYFENLSLIDGLTGIYNRRSFDERLRLEWPRAVRSGSPLSILLMDIDYFKLFNDNYGHQTGDDCLRRVATALNGNIERSTDLLARYGGEEFVCLLPGTGNEGACHFGDRLRRSVADLGIPHAHSKAAPSVTISLGCASITPDKDARWEDLVKTADDNLYKAKEAGRNRIRCS